MPHGESLYSNQPPEGEAMKPTLVLERTSLGPQNIGPFGPEGRIAPGEYEDVVTDLGDERYSVPATNRVICMDDRLKRGEKEQAEQHEVHEADSQLGGSIPASETAAHYMDSSSAHHPVSFMYASTTREASDDGLVVVVHGDTTNGKGGCAANVKLREVLRFSAENSDIVAPLVWGSCIEMGLDEHISREDVHQSILTGEESANDDSLWDVTPEQRIDIAVANGAEYEEYEGEHYAVATRIDRTDRAFAKAKYVIDHSKGGTMVSALSVSMGKYKQVAFERATMHGRSERDAALQVMRVMTFNLAANKMLTTEKTEAAVVNYERN